MFKPREVASITRVLVTLLVTKRVTKGVTGGNVFRKYKEIYPWEENRGVKGSL